jgi:hypothetical protein
MPVDGDQETVIERRVAGPRPSAAGPMASVLIVLGVIAAVAFGWWVVGTTPAPDGRTPEAPNTTSADNPAPRAALPESAKSRGSL